MLLTVARVMVTWSSVPSSRSAARIATLGDDWMLVRGSSIT